MARAASSNTGAVNTNRTRAIRKSPVTLVIPYQVGPSRWTNLPGPVWAWSQRVCRTMSGASPLSIIRATYCGKGGAPLSSNKTIEDRESTASILGESGDSSLFREQSLFDCGQELAHEFRTDGVLLPLVCPRQLAGHVQFVQHGQAREGPARATRGLPGSAGVPGPEDPLVHRHHGVLFAELALPELRRWGKLSARHHVVDGWPG